MNTEHEAIKQRQSAPELYCPDCSSLLKDIVELEQKAERDQRIIKALSEALIKITRTVAKEVHDAYPSLCEAREIAHDALALAKDMQA